MLIAPKAPAVATIPPCVLVPELSWRVAPGATATDRGATGKKVTPVPLTVAARNAEVPKVTAVAQVKLLPMIVTAVPPAAGPELGNTDVITGAVVGHVTADAVMASGPKTVSGTWASKRAATTAATGIRPLRRCNRLTRLGSPLRTIGRRLSVQLYD